VDRDPRWQDQGMDLFDGRACKLGEGPYYDDRTGRAGWVDVFGRRVLWRDVESGETGEIPTPSEVSAAVPRTNGGLALLLAEGPALADPDGTLHVLDPYDDPEPGVLVRTNDAKADPAGRLWFGTMSRDTSTPRGALYRLDPGTTTPKRVLSDVIISNGLGWHGSLMYYVDSLTDRIDVFDYDAATGEIAGRRPFATLPRPDGLCVDADGGVWVAMFGAGLVRRYTSDGAIEREVKVPTPQTTSCAFIGPAFDTLIITTAARRESKGVAGAGVTYQRRFTDVVGTPVDRYAG
jgi:sugar lactone lactonase YvrE